jgi:hypothetical protein
MSPMLYSTHWILVLVQKGNNAKKRKLLQHGNLKRLDKVYPKQEKQKRKSDFFYHDNFMLP